MNADPQPTACHLSLGHQLRHHTLRHVGGDGKADPLRKVDDRRVDADDLPAYVKERAARVARVDRGIRLDKVFVPGEIHIFPTQRADHPDRERAVQAEGVADRDGPLAHPDLRRISERDDRQLASGLDLDEGQVGIGVFTDDLARELRLVREADFDRFGVSHHVVVGQDKALFADNHTGARSGWGLIGTATRVRPVPLTRRGGIVGNRGDVHDGRLDLFGQTDENIL